MIIVLLKSATCDKKVLRFPKKQEMNGLLSSLGIRTPLSKVSFFGNNPF